MTGKSDTPTVTMSVEGELDQMVEYYRRRRRQLVLLLFFRELLDGADRSKKGSAKKA